MKSKLQRNEIKKLKRAKKVAYKKSMVPRNVTLKNDFKKETRNHLNGVSAGMRANTELDEALEKEYGENWIEERGYEFWRDTKYKKLLATLYLKQACDIRMRNHSYRDGFMYGLWESYLEALGENENSENK